ncbi:hypothetical protein [Granulicella arctica]|uniref:hypothetical protein n=1 Tax=Granulicella arctica TaxID=940613 RepID=UPI0021E09181|nr:hypothetical protein [Granulicella arctica]
MTDYGAADTLLPDISPFEIKPINSRALVSALLNLLASIQFVWFYLSCTPSYLDLYRYEQGLERTPFQDRLLMMFPLAWAHQDPMLIQLAKVMTSLPAWFPGGVRAEELMQAPIDLACVVVTGLVARAMYVKASPYKLLAPYVYPLTLIMLTTTYTIYTMHRLRFIYDLPSVGFFSLGLYLIYVRKSSHLFIILFIIATVNRETTVFLLPFYLISEYFRYNQNSYAKSVKPFLLGSIKSRMTWTVLLPLAAYWVYWHAWVTKHFAHNSSESLSRIWLNVGILLWPTSWIQILSVFAFSGPLIYLSRKLIADETLRAWQWVFPMWFIFMVRYGILIEVRIFGELIPYIACLAVLIAEKHIILEAERQRSVLSISTHPSS